MRAGTRSGGRSPCRRKGISLMRGGLFHSPRFPWNEAHFFCSGQVQTPSLIFWPQSYKTQLSSTRQDSITWATALPPAGCVGVEAPPVPAVGPTHGWVGSCNLSPAPTGTAQGPKACMGMSFLQRPRCPMHRQSMVSPGIYLNFYFEALSNSQNLAKRLQRTIGLGEQQ